MAINIFDRYLASVGHWTVPRNDISALYVVSILLAAKVEEAVQPNFNVMLSLLDEEDRGKVTKSDLIDMEAKVLVKFGFDFNFSNPQIAVERHMRLLGYDKQKLVSDMGF